MTNVIEKVASGVVGAARHPLVTSARALGFARGIAAATLRAASGAGGPSHAEWIPPPDPLPVEAVDEHATDRSTEEPTPLRPAPSEPPVSAAPQRPPAPPGEAFATEPTAVTRDSAHGSGGRDAEIDEWYEDTSEEGTGPVGVVEILEAHDPDDLGPDLAVIKELLHESETLRKAAERDPEP